MPRLIPALIAPAALFAVSCAAVSADPAPQGQCPLADTGGWAAWIDAMPGPNAGPTLIVTGQVTAPTGGYRPKLELEQVAESHPVQVFARLHPNPPEQGATQAIVTHDVRGEWPMGQQVGSVAIRCGDSVIASIAPVETAR